MQAVTKPKSMAALTGSEAQDLFSQYVPREVWGLENPQTAIPRIAKDSDLVRRIEARVQNIPTAHDVYLGDARRIPTFNRKVSTSSSLLLPTGR